MNKNVISRCTALVAITLVCRIGGSSISRTNDCDIVQRYPQVSAQDSSAAASE